MMKGLAGEPAPEDGDGPKSAGEIAAAALAKAVTDGQVEEGPDVALGQQIMGLLARAIQNEAAEIEAGAYDETMDVRTLARAADMIASWTGREQGGCGCCPMCTGLGCGCCGWCAPGTDGMVMDSVAYPPDDVAKAPREFSADERKKHAKEGNALPDGSYPIPDKDALRRAATLARSGHGDVAAAKKLIAKRAKELGVANPLDDDKSDGASKGAAVAEGGTAVDTDGQETGSLSKAVEDALAKAVGPLKERLEAFGADLAKVMAAPVPGGPVLSNVRATARAGGGEDWAAKAAYYGQKAELAVSPEDRDGYRQLAREAQAKAQAVTA
jgi:hypothetical protein